MSLQGQARRFGLSAKCPEATKQQTSTDASEVPIAGIASQYYFTVPIPIS
jgi:hypothetical protein